MWFNNNATHPMFYHMIIDQFHQNIAILFILAWSQKTYNYS